MKLRIRLSRLGLIPAALGLLLGAPLPLHAAGGQPVDAEIALLIDVSRSVDAEKFRTQRDSYVNAFEDPGLFSECIGRGPRRRIAASLVYWSSPEHRELAVDWRLIDSVSTSAAFAAAVARNVPFGASLKAGGHPFSGTTAPGSAIHFILPTFAGNHFDGARKVIMLSGDGLENDGTSTAQARDDALRAGIDAIDAIPIGSPALAHWFTANVQGGAQSFTEAVADFEGIPGAIRRSLRRAIGCVAD